MYTSINNNSKIILKENRSSLEIINKRNLSIEIHKVDGGIINDHRLRCDYLFYDPNKKEHYVELKGSDVGHALEQIISTINILGKNIYKDEKFAFIICTRHPQLDTKIQRLKKEIKIKYNSNLIVKSNNYQFVII